MESVYEKSLQKYVFNFKWKRAQPTELAWHPTLVVERMHVQVREDRAKNGRHSIWVRDILNSSEMSRKQYRTFYWSFTPIPWGSLIASFYVIKNGKKYPCFDGKKPPFTHETDYFQELTVPFPHILPSGKRLKLACEFHQEEGGTKPKVHYAAVEDLVTHEVHFDLLADKESQPNIQAKALDIITGESQNLSLKSEDFHVTIQEKSVKDLMTGKPSNSFHWEVKIIRYQPRIYEFTWS